MIPHDTEEELIKKYKPLVAKLARTFNPATSEDLQDLIQVGCIGLLKGIRKFDPSRKNKLSTFVYRPILWELIKYAKKCQRATCNYSMTQLEFANNIPLCYKDFVSLLQEIIPSSCSELETQVIWLKSHGYTFSEISVLIERTKSTTSKIYYRAIQKIKESYNAIPT